MPDGTAAGIGVRIRDLEMAGEVATELNDKLGFPFSVQSWMTQNRALFSALRLEKLAMSPILFLIVLWFASQDKKHKRSLFSNLLFLGALGWFMSLLVNGDRVRGRR